MTRKKLKELKQWHLKALQLHIRECLKKERGNTGNGGAVNGTDSEAFKTFSKLMYLPPRAVNGTDSEAFKTLKD